MSEQNHGAEAAPVAPQKQSVLTERALQPGGRDANGRVARMHTSIRRDCVSLSAPFDGEWVSVLFPISEFDTLLLGIKQMIVAKEPTVGEVDAHIGAGENRRLDGTVRFGRDEDGIVYITIVNNGREQRFDFRPNDNYVWKINGQPLPMSDASRRNAQAWVDRMGDYCAQELRDNYIGFQGRQDGQAGGQRQGGNNYNRNGGGYNRGGNNYNRNGNGGGYNRGGNGYQGKGGGNGYQNNNWNRGGNGNGGGYNRGGQGGQGGGGNRNYQGGGNYQNQGQQQAPAAPAEPSVDFDAYVNAGVI